MPDFLKPVVLEVSKRPVITMIISMENVFEHTTAAAISVIGPIMADAG
jgi:hypothetical protein